MADFRYLKDSSLYTSLLPTEILHLILPYLYNVGFFIGPGFQGELGLGRMVNPSKFIYQPQMFNSLVFGSTISLMILDGRLFFSGRVKHYFTKSEKKAIKNKYPTNINKDIINNMGIAVNIFIDMFHFKPFNHKVKKVATEGSHIAILTEENTLFTLGDNTDGELGIGKEKKSTKYNQIDTDVLDIACGDSSIFYLKNGSLFGCGLVFSGLLGLKVTDISYTPTQITEFNNIVQIYASYNTVIFITDKNEIYVIGNYSFLKDNMFTSVPMKIADEYFLDVPDNIQKVSIGGGFILIMADNLLYGCGTNKKGQLGLPQEIHAINKIQLLLIPDVALIEDIACTSVSSTVIAEGKPYSTWLPKKSDKNGRYYMTYVYRFEQIDQFDPPISPKLRFTQVVSGPYNTGLITNQFEYL